jgi:hypothetical protein
MWPDTGAGSGTGAIRGGRLTCSGGGVVGTGLCVWGGLMWPKTGAGSGKGACWSVEK